MNIQLLKLFQNLGQLTVAFFEAVHGVHDLCTGVLFADFADLGGKTFQLVSVRRVVIHHIADQRQQLILGGGVMAVAMIVVMMMAVVMIVMMVLVAVVMVVIMLMMMLVIMGMLMGMGVGMLMFMLMVVGVAVRMVVRMIVIRTVGMGMGMGVLMNVGMRMIVMFVLVMHGESSLIIRKGKAGTPSSL